MSKEIKEVRVHSKFGGDGCETFVSLILDGDIQHTFDPAFDSQVLAQSFADGIKEGLRLADQGYKEK
jgi:hypothetical protein